MTLIICEIGINHGGDFKRALEMIDVAKECGADAVKFQSFTADKLGYDEKLTEFLRGVQLNVFNHIQLKNHADAAGIEFLSTPFDAGWCDFLVDIGVTRIKISSGKAKDLAFVRHVASKGLPVIMSTGMATENEMHRATSELWVNNVSATLLYCVSEYPAPLSTIDLRQIADLKYREHGDTYDGYRCNAVGYSDHSGNPAVGVLAAAAGARVLEAHLTLDKTAPGPDHVASLTPDEFRMMVEGVRNVG